MPVDFFNGVDLNQTELQFAKIHSLASDPGTPVAGQVYYNTTSNTLKFYNGSTWHTLGRLDQITAPTGDVNLNSQKITNLGTPSAGTDATTKTYVDNLVSGLIIKDAVRVATTANVDLFAGGLSNGETIDGVTIATGDRILVKSQTDQTENGIYVVPAGVSASRATDADTGAELRGGTFVLVQEGTTYADTGWVASHNGTPTLGSTNITFAQFSGGGSVTAGAGLTLTGSTLDVGAGTGITVNANDVALTGQALALHNLATSGLIARTGAGTVAGRTLTAGTGIGITNGDGVSGNPTIAIAGDVVRKYTTTIGDGSTTAIAITSGTHGLAANGNMQAQCFDASTGAQVFPDISINNSNGTVTFTFAVAPSTNAYRIVLEG